MSLTNPQIYLLASHRHTFETGVVSLVAAGTATAGHILALRNAHASKIVRLRALEVEFLLTTAFGAAQEVGFDAFIARTYTAAHTGATALTLTGSTGKRRSALDATQLTGRIADTGALTAGTHTLDTNPIARGSFWAGAVGAALAWRRYDFSQAPYGGILLEQDTGLVTRNLVAMGAVGSGKWRFSIETDDVLVD